MLPLSLFLFALPFLNAIDVPITEDKIPLTVQFEQLEEDWYGKQILVGVWNEQKGEFPDNGTFAEKAFMLSAAEQSTTLSLHTDTYAVSCFVDLNGDGELNTNFFGIPSEPYCFSKNYKPVMSAPDFVDCAFALTKAQTIKLTFIQ